MAGKSASYFRMDEQVVYTMAGVCIISFIVLAFRFITDKPCTPVSINYISDSIFVNEVVHFKTNIKAEKGVYWNFGDGSIIKEGESSINHRFKEPRTYSVKVVVNGECSDIQSIVVHDRKPVITPSPEPVLNAPQTAYVNENVRFYDASSSSTSWEWYFEDNQEVLGREREVYYTFTTSGSKKIILKVNKNPNLTVTRFITIYDKPLENTGKSDVAGPSGGRRGNPPKIKDVPDEDPIGENDKKDIPPVIADPPKVEKVEPVKGADISKDQLEAALYAVSQGDKSAADFAPYFCGKTDIKVGYDNKVYDFAEFCTELKKIGKKVRRIHVTPTKNQNNCILSMQVTVRRRFLGL